MCHGTSQRSRLPRGGFTVVEVLVCVVILSIALSGFTGTLVAALGLNRVQSETVVAREAAQEMLETIHGRTFGEAFAAFNASAADDGSLLTPAFGASFDVPGLEPLPGDPDGRCGEVLFPDSGNGPTFLAEDEIDAALGLPLDLNGDGVIDAANHAADYRMLPVRVRVAWRSAAGPRRLDLETLLCAR